MWPAHAQTLFPDMSLLPIVFGGNCSSLEHIHIGHSSWSGNSFSQETEAAGASMDVMGLVQKASNITDTLLCARKPIITCNYSLLDVTSSPQWAPTQK